MIRIMAPHRINTSNIDPAFSSTKAEEKISIMREKKRWVYLFWDNFCHWIDFILGNELSRTLTLTINREASQMRSLSSSESTPILMSKHWRETFRESSQSWYLNVWSRLPCPPQRLAMTSEAMEEAIANSIWTCPWFDGAWTIGYTFFPRTFLLTVVKDIEQSPSGSLIWKLKLWKSLP